MSNLTVQSDFNLLDAIEEHQMQGVSAGGLGTSVIFTMVIVTPELANNILINCNDKNRPMSRGNVRKLTSEIKAGNWQFDGSPIRFDKDGRLIDGQHRLTALIKTNFSTPMLVIYGLQSESFKVIDTGKNRSGSDVLAIDNIPNSTYVSSTLNFLSNYYDNKYKSSTKRILTNTKKIEFYKTLDNLDSSVEFGLKHKSNKILNIKFIIGFHYLFSNIDIDAGEEFLSKLDSGIGLTEDHPVLVLRNKLMKSIINKNYTMNEKEIVSSVIYAWNKFRAGENLKIIKLTSDFDNLIK